MKSRLLAFWSRHQPGSAIDLNPEPKDFGFVYIFEFVRSDTQVCSMWRGIAEFVLKSLAFLGIEIEPIICGQVWEVLEINLLITLIITPVFSANVRSSTYFQYSDWALAAVSLMRTWKPTGPNLVPWGTQAVSCRSSESLLLNLTHCRRFWRKLQIDGIIFLISPIWMILFIRMVWSTKSLGKICKNYRPLCIATLFSTFMEVIDQVDEVVVVLTHQLHCQIA